MPEDTPNHGYRRPAKGAGDWHIPLNENFARIDSDVEIRDEASNRGQYEPREGAKFLATDTRVIYLGDGDSWQTFGTVATVPDGSQGKVSNTDGIPMPDGTVIAPPGSVQSTIDAVATDSEFARQPARTVRLISGLTYEISETISLKPGTVLECNGARIVPERDVDLFELYPDTHLVAPFCDTRNVEWDSAQIVVGAKDGGKVDVSNRAWVSDAYLMGEPGRGIGVQFRGGDRPCSMQTVNGTVNGFDKALDFYAAGDRTDQNGSWSNGNQFYGRIRNFRIGVSMRSEGAAVSGNQLILQVQPNDANAEWLWRMEQDPRDSRGDDMYVMKGNTVVAHPWDVGQYDNEYYRQSDRNAPIWFIGRGKRYGNSLIDHSGLLSNEFVVNNSDDANRNGIFTAHGGFVVGTTDFSRPPAYQQNDSRVWHRDSQG